MLSDFPGAQERTDAFAMRKDIDPLKTVPLIALSQAGIVDHALSNLPPYDELTIFDLQHQRRSHTAIVQQGFAFTENIRWWGLRRATEASMGAGASEATSRTGNTMQAVGIISAEESNRSRGNELFMRWPRDTVPMPSAAPDALLPAAAAASEDYRNLYGRLADLWSGIPPPVDPHIGGCALEYIPPTQPLDLEKLQPGIINLRKLQGGSYSSAEIQSTGLQGALAPASSRGHLAALGGSYVVFQPPAGIGEYFVALRNAAGVAAALRRTLVVPHLLWTGDIASPIAFSKVFDLSALRQSMHRAGQLAGYDGKVIEIDEFRQLGIRPVTFVRLPSFQEKLAACRFTSWSRRM